VECVELIERRGHGTHTLHIAFRNGEDVVELWLNRTRRPFAARDIAVLTMLAPLLRRLVRERPTAGLPDCLTTQERRVLGLVASGLTNAEIAERLSVAPCTVRKHLEHTYRKLGVSGRMGAIAALQGRDDPGLDLVARLERFA
jgi:DNA-binding NarL/FixJ family response regulator